MHVEDYPALRWEYDGLPGFEDNPWRMPWYRRNWCGRKPADIWSPGTWDDKTWCSDVLAMDACAYCGGMVQVIDHIDPVSRGGKDWWGNFAPCCRRCNASKSGRPLLLWMLKRQIKRDAQEAA